jgi:hypothetical protein
MFKVEITEPTRVILKDEESKAYVTLSFHEEDKEGLNSIKSLSVGEEMEISIEKVQERPQVVEPEKEPEKEPIQPPSLSGQNENFEG